jgi:hypothetical protein
LVPRLLDEGSRPKSGKLRLYMASILEGKSIGLDQKIVLKGELLLTWRTKNQVRDQGKVQFKDSIWFKLIQIGS